MTRRWFRYGDLDGYINEALSPVTLICGYCREKPDELVYTSMLVYIRQDWQFRTRSLRALINHYGNEHAEDFVSVQSIRNQTLQWKNEWIARQPGPHLWTYGTIRRSVSPDFPFGGLTS